MNPSSDPDYRIGWARSKPFGSPDVTCKTHDLTDVRDHVPRDPVRDGESHLGQGGVRSRLDRLRLCCAGLEAAANLA